jgi:farnesyl diphosphate synthase
MSSLASAFQQRLESVSAATEAAMMELLRPEPLPGEAVRPERLISAMRYSASGGKRLRPFLVVESAALFGVAQADALPAGLALECIHCYSLIHDDLPAMDNDPLRRGKPTAHVKFDEATAILSGDSLLTMTFDLLASAPMKISDASRLALIQLVSRSSGIGGMAGGQMLDLEAEGRFSADGKPLKLAVQEIEKLQAMKTGALLAAACEAGAIIGSAKDNERAALKTYARALGLAFQIADDLLDAVGEAASLGKAAGKDAGLGKATLVSLLGVNAARDQMNGLITEAANALTIFGERGSILAECARYIGARKN